VIDAENGKLVKEQSLIKDVDYRQWNPESKNYTVHRGVNLREVRDLSPRNQMGPSEGDSRDAGLAREHRGGRLPLLSDPAPRTGATTCRRRDAAVLRTAWAA